MVHLCLPMIFELGILKINPIFVPCNYTMQKRLPFVPSLQKSRVLRFSVSLSFNSRGTHLPVFWIFPISLSLSCPIGNILLTNAQLLSELFLCFRIIFVQQCLQFHIFEFFGGFSRSSSCFLYYVEVTSFKMLKPSFTGNLRWSMLTISFSK